MWHVCGLKGAKSTATVEHFDKQDLQIPPCSSSRNFISTLVHVVPLAGVLLPRAPTCKAPVPFACAPSTTSRALPGTHLCMRNFIDLLVPLNALARTVSHYIRPGDGSRCPEVPRRGQMGRGGTLLSTLPPHAICMCPSVKAYVDTHLVQ